MKPSLILQHRSSSLSPNKVPSLDKNPNLHNHFYPSLGILLLLIIILLIIIIIILFYNNLLRQALLN